MNCSCGAEATCECIIYSNMNVTLMRCFDCAFNWLKATSRCPKCGGDLKSHTEKSDNDKAKCKYMGTLDRGVRSVKHEFNNENN